MPKTKLLTAFITLFLAGLATAQTAPNPGHIGTQVNVLDPSQTGTPQTNLQTALNNIFAAIGSGGGTSYWIQTPDRNLYYNAGNVGIGTTNPVSKLDVRGVVTSSDTADKFITVYGGSDIRSIIFDDFDSLNFGTWNNRGGGGYGTKMSLTKDGDILNKGIMELSDLDIGNRYSFIDFHGDDTYSDYGLRIIRENVGPNASSIVAHRGTGPLVLTAQDAGAVEIKTQDISRIYVNSAGNVGIGTTNPGAKLDVQTGAVRIHTAGSDLGRIEFKRTSDSWHMGTIEVSHTGNYGGDLSFKLHPNNGVVGTAPVTVMFLQSSGNVGIGIPPISRLHLDKAGSGNYVRFSEGGILRGVVGVSGGGSDLLGSDSDNDFVVRGESNIKFGVGAAQRMIIDSAGEVGIGTAAPDMKLQVITPNTTSGIEVATSSGTDRRRVQISANTDGGALGTGAGYIDAFRIGTGAIPLILNVNGGSVAIGGGTPSATSKLHVFGRLRADEICLPNETGSNCKTAWPAGGSGTVTAVTASSPLASSGGTAPNINLTGTVPVANGGTGATTLSGLLRGNGTSAFTALTTSTGISGAITDETGTGSLVFATSPTFGGSINFPGSGIWNSNGKVGIGTTGPGAKLEVFGSGVNTDTTSVRITNVVGKTYSLSSGIRLINESGFSIRDVTADTIPFVIDTSGNVGIGRIPSAYKLEVAGVIKADSSLITGGDIMFVEAGNDSGLQHGGDGDVRLITNGVDKLVIDSSGVNIKNTLLKVGTNGPILHPAYIKLPPSGAQPLTCDTLARGLMYFDTSAGGGSQVPCVCLYVSGSWQWRPFDNLAGTCD